MSTLYCIICCKDADIKDLQTVTGITEAHFVYKGMSLCFKHIFQSIQKEIGA